MSHSDWKVGFDAGVDFCLHSVNEHCNTKFTDLSDLIRMVYQLSQANPALVQEFKYFSNNESKETS
jgi:hypothetical protein